MYIYIYFAFIYLYVFVTYICWYIRVYFTYIHTYVSLYIYIYTYTYIYIYMCVCVCLYILIYCTVALPWNLTICNDSLYNRILAIFLPWNFVWILLEFRWHFVGISWQNVLPHDFASFFRSNFVRISLELPNEIFTKFERFFLRQNVVAKRFATPQKSNIHQHFNELVVCGKMSCHNMLPIKNAEILLANRPSQQIPNEISANHSTVFLWWQNIW